MSAPPHGPQGAWGLQAGHSLGAASAAPGVSPPVACFWQAQRRAPMDKAPGLGSPTTAAKLQAIQDGPRNWPVHLGSRHDIRFLRPGFIRWMGARSGSPISECVARRPPKAQPQWISKPGIHARRQGQALGDRKQRNRPGCRPPHGCAPACWRLAASMAGAKSSKGRFSPRRQMISA